MCTYFKAEADVVQNLIDNIFFQPRLSEDPSIRRILSEKQIGGMVLLVERNERAKAATSSYSAPVDFLQCIYSVLVAKNH